MNFDPSNVVQGTNLDLLSSSSTSFDPDDVDQKPKRRRQTRRLQTDVVSRRKISFNPQRKPRSTPNSGTSAAHEVRVLRAQVATMEEELRGLKLKWTTSLPDENTLAAGYRSASNRFAMIQTETTHRELQQMLLQHKLFFATLQSAVHRAPLYSAGKEFHDMIHFNTRLSLDSTDREEKLKSHYTRAITTIPAIMDHVTNAAMEKEVSHRIEPDLPLSQMEITACEDGTLVSSVFMSEIPHTTLEEVFAGVLAFFDAIPTWMKRHFDIDSTHTRLNNPDSPIVYWRSTLNGGGLPATVNHIVCSELTPSHGMLHMDAITNDPLNPIPTTSPLEYGICGLTVTPNKELKTGKTTSVTLRWAAVYRYRLMPNDPAIKQDLEIVRPILNGDLITSVVCEYINSKQRSASECTELH